MEQSRDGFSSTYQLKIVLQGVPSPVWRCVLVSGDDNLSRLSAILLAALGWAGYHKHRFNIGGHEYGIAQSDELLFVDAAAGHAPEFDESKVTLRELALSPHEMFRYDYNPGAGWTHEVIVERLLEPDGEPLPRCIDGAGACPPEESGGPARFAEFLAIQADPRDPRHEELRDSWGGIFDPDFFRVSDVNERLSLFWPLPRAQEQRTGWGHAPSP